MPYTVNHLTKMVRLTIDNKKIKVEEGTTLLETAQKLNIEIPTLCHHQALKPYGACRVCLVEVIKGSRLGLVASCTYPAEEGLVARTETERVKRARRLSIELLLARCPTSEKVREVALELGVKKVRFKEEKEECILCGLCVRVCEEAIAKSAISFINRGADREVTTPFKIGSLACIGCGACVYLCPTGAIKIEDVRKCRRLDFWNTKLELKKCKVCGKHFVPLVELDYLKDRIKSFEEMELPEEALEVCPKCRKRILSEKAGEFIFGEKYP